MMAPDGNGQSPSAQFLPGARKAMTVLNALDGPALERLVQYFDKDDLARIRSIDEDLKPVDAGEFTAILEEFASRFVHRLRMVGKNRKPQGLLEEALSPEDLKRLTGDEGGEETPVWKNERFAKPEILTPLVQSEHPQTAAFILSRVDDGTSAEVIRALDDGLRGEILLRMLDMHPVSPGVTMIIEQHVRVSFIEDTSKERNAEARARIAAIVNRMNKSLAEQFLQMLGEERPEEAREIRQLLFSFEDIVKLEQKDRMVLFDRAPVEATIKALHGADGALRDLVLESLGGRMRKMVEAELRGGNAPDEDAAQEARREIAALALELARQGEIVISVDDKE